MTYFTQQVFTESIIINIHETKYQFGNEATPKISQQGDKNH